MPILPPARGIALERAMASTIIASPTTSLPTYLVPAWRTSLSSRKQPPRSVVALYSSTHGSAKSPISYSRCFSTTGGRHSKLGKTPLSIPPGVEMTVGEPWLVKDLTTYVQNYKKTVTISGPLGKVSYDIPNFVKVDYNEAERVANLEVEDSGIRKQKEMWGTTWAYLNRHIMGVSEGHTAVLRLVGIGYRASVESRPEQEEYPGQPFVCIKLGYTHPVEMGVPEGVKASTPAPTRILLEGVNREDVMSFAGRIREWKKPEPYKGKGIFINDETIKLKQKKIK